MLEHVEVPDDQAWTTIKRADGVALGRFSPRPDKIERACCRGKYYVFVEHEAGTPSSPCWVGPHGVLTTAQREDFLFDTQEAAEEALACYLLLQSGGE